MYSEDGQAFVVLHATTRKGLSRIRVTLTPGSVVTTLKNTVDNVVTEHGGVLTRRGIAVPGAPRAGERVERPSAPTG